MTQVTRNEQYIDLAVLYMAIELSKNTWRVAFSSKGKNRQVSVEARNLPAMLSAISKAKARFKLAENAKVVCCYEAGLDGFWIHRWLESQGISSMVVDPASIEVNRRKRRAKTDRLDAQSLVRQLVRYHQGERSVWSVVCVPDEDAEDCRRPHRELASIKSKRNRVRNQIWSFLMGQGICDFGYGNNFEKRLKELVLWNGKGLPQHLQAELVRLHEEYELLQNQIKGIRVSRQAELKDGRTKTACVADQLMGLRAVGENGAWLLAAEFFAWRKFNNGKEVGSLAGLTGTPYDSGGSQREQGISKAGNWRVRTMVIELAWCWLRWQPESKMSKWFRERFGGGSKRMRRVGIVALARKLLVALWRYVSFGEIPEGALLTEA